MNSIVLAGVMGYEFAYGLRGDNQTLGYVCVCVCVCVCAHTDRQLGRRRAGSRYPFVPFVPDAKLSR